MPGGLALDTVQAIGINRLHHNWQFTENGAEQLPLVVKQPNNLGKLILTAQFETMFSRMLWLLELHYTEYHQLL